MRPISVDDDVGRRYYYYAHYGYAYYYSSSLLLLLMRHATTTTRCHTDLLPLTIEATTANNYYLRDLHYGDCYCCDMLRMRRRVWTCWGQGRHSVC